MTKYTTIAGDMWDGIAYKTLGDEAYGTNKWVITKLSNSLKRFDRWGNLLVASVNVTMQSYAVR